MASAIGGCGYVGDVVRRERRDRATDVYCYRVPSPADPRAGRAPPIPHADDAHITRLWLMLHR
jgi:hypothetical protein